jgi:L-2,4-diaminobutyrate decarboxylase
MTDLLNKAFDTKSFRETGHILVDMLSNYFDLIKMGESELPVLPFKSPSEMYSYWENDFKESGNSDLKQFFKILIENSIHLHNPKYLGHQVPPVLPEAAIVDFLSAFLNNATGVYEMGSAGIALERFVIKFLARTIGMEGNADGVLTSGGTLGNLTALLAIRQIKLKNNVWSEGINNEETPAFLVSEESHYSVERAIHIMGIGDNGIIKVPVNGDDRKILQRSCR